MLDQPEPSAPIPDRSTRVRRTMVMMLWMLAFGVSMAGWLAALSYVGYLVFRRVLS